MIDTRTAPVQGSTRGKGAKRQRIPAGLVPWAVHALAWETYRADGHGHQSAERIAERGGFDWVELIACLRGSYNDLLRDADTTSAELFAGVEDR